MNKLFVAFCLFSFLISCDIRNSGNRPDVNIANGGLSTMDSTTVQVIDSVYNFGKVADGEMVEYSYRFKNNGTYPLIIYSAVASCGCTVPEKPKEPVKPGETGFLKVVFNSKGRVGPVHKDITVMSNAHPAFPVLQLVGEVESSNK